VKKKIVPFFFVCIIAAFFIFEKPMEACAPYDVDLPWEVEFENGTIFYMTPLRHPSQSTMEHRNITEERMQIRTGLYYANGENIYFADINANEWSVFFSACGRYFATVQPTVDNFDDEILGGGMVNFFENGVLTRSYTAQDLRMRTPRSWEREPWHRYDEAINANLDGTTLTVGTINLNTFVFDITTGEIIRQTIFRQSLLMFFGGIVLIAAVIFLLWKRRRKTD
jgi:hypothetical protein